MERAQPATANKLEAAYEVIPKAQRQTWHDRADKALAAASMPDWVRIAPVLKEMALRF